MDFIDKAYDISLLSIKEVFVYKVPPLRSASGHRAEDWDLATPLFTGYSAIYSFIYRFIYLLAYSLTCSLSHFLTYVLIHLLTYSLVDIYSLTHTLTHPLAHSLTDTHWYSPILTHSLSHTKAIFVSFKIIIYYSYDYIITRILHRWLIMMTI